MTVGWILAIAGTARAYDLDSLRSDATSGLFRDEYDYLREPATLGEQRGRHLYTILGNQGAADRMSLGFVGRLGPGVLGFIADGAVESDDQTTTELTAPEYDENNEPLRGEIATTRRSFSRTRKGGLFAGYGVPLGRSLSLGAGAEWTGEVWDTTLDSENVDDFSIGGSLTREEEDGIAIEENAGEYRRREEEARAVLGAAFGAGPLDVEADVQVSRTRRLATGWATRFYADEYGAGTYWFAGVMPDAGLEDNVTATLSGGALDATLDLGRDVALRLFADGAGGVGTLPAWEWRESWDPSTESDDTRGTLIDPEFRLAEADGLLALQFAGERVEARAGIAAEWEREALAVTRAVEAERDSEDRVERVSSLQHYLAWSLPIAVEAHASRPWTLRAGGRFVRSALRYGSEYTLHTEPSSGEITSLTQESSSSQTYVSLALGARWEVAPRLSLDLVATGTGFPDEQRVAVDLGSILFSAVFHLPGPSPD